jgi:hypothetical protein
MSSYCLFLLQPKHNTKKKPYYLHYKQLQSRLSPCTFHISEWWQYLSMDDNIETSKLKVRMPKILFKILLYHHQPSYDPTQ